MTYKFTDTTQTVVHVIDPDGVRRKSMLATDVPEGAEILPPDSLTKTVSDQIDALEATITPYRIRKAILGTDGGWLADVDSQIDALRAQL